MRRPWRILILLAGLLVLLVAVWLGAAAAVYSPEYVRRVLLYRESDLGDYLHHFPLRDLQAFSEPFYFDVAADEGRVRLAFQDAFGVEDFDAFLADNGTQAFIVIEDDAVLYEHYFNGVTRDSMLTSFSVAKSFDSAMVGIAIAEGFIDDVDDPVTKYLPELAERDDRFEAITLRHLLRMASGLEYEEMRWALFNGDDPLTTYHPDQRDLALTNTHVEEPPGGHFRYNKYHPQLLGMVLERTTGMSVTDYTQTRLWDPLGMEFDASWALDSEESGFEKMEAGLNARAIDYAKLGRLYLEGGRWNGKQVVPEAWVRESTSVDTATQNEDYYRTDFGRAIFADGGGYYKYLWYGRLRDGAPADFYAEGDHGQFIYVSPARRLIIVRNGTAFGMAGSEWIDGFYRAAERL